MPKYDFKCDVCGNQIVVSQSIHLEIKAPECCGKLTWRDYSEQNAGVEFKGRGFYVTDNRR